jgi:hypothetical protein
MKDNGGDERMFRERVKYPTFTTHGEPEAAAAMAGYIHDEFGWNVVVPQYQQTIELE